VVKEITKENDLIFAVMEKIVPLKPAYPLSCS
jgi:hypothetical protein